MSDKHETSQHSNVDLENGRGHTHVTLTASQFESLYLQPGGPGNRLAPRFANAAPLGLTAFLIAHVPLSMDLLGFQGATGASSLAMLGAFFGVAGVGLYLTAIFEWIAGNTFPMVVFASFGGFWTTYGVIIQPSMKVAAGFASPNVTDSTPAGVIATASGLASREFNSGLAMFFVMWMILGFMYLVASLRTNVPFFIVFFMLICLLGALAAGYFHNGVGETARAAKEFRAAGAFAFVVGMAALWIDFSLILASVDFPVRIPVLDISGWRLLQPRRQGNQETGEKIRND